MPKTISTELYI
jgi:LETM1 and EF-hand domain-containing protein 1, mitochondrial